MSDFNDDDDLYLDENIKLDPIARLSRDIKQAALKLGDAEARFLVDAYYIMQDGRKRSSSQERTLNENDEPNLILSWLADQSSVLETQIKNALDLYTKNHLMGSWMREIYGIGPVISAGLLAHIYMGRWCQTCHGRNEKDCAKRQRNKELKLPKHSYTEEISCPTAGHIWQFAGIAGDGQRVWVKGSRRPFNAKLKTLQWKVGQSFMKFSNDEKCIYGRHYRNQKLIYIKRNDAGGFTQRASELATRVKKTTDAWAWYIGRYPAGASSTYENTGLGLAAIPKQKAKVDYLSSVKLQPAEGLPMLPPGHVDGMARRWAVKIFLSHLHAAWYEKQFNEPPPAPYPVAILGHAHQI
jgi:hypothetical protein